MESDKKIATFACDFICDLRIGLLFVGLFRALAPKEDPIEVLEFNEFIK